MSSVTDRIRINVAKTRKRELEEEIESIVRWSRDSSKRNWLTRFFFRLPDHEYTREEAIDCLKVEDEWFGSRFDRTQRYGIWVLELADAVDFAESNNLPLKLTAEQVNSLNSWAE